MSQQERAAEEKKTAAGISNRGVDIAALGSASSALVDYQKQWQAMGGAGTLNTSGYQQTFTTTGSIPGSMSYSAANLLKR